MTGLTDPKAKEQGDRMRRVTRDITARQWVPLEGKGRSFRRAVDLEKLARVGRSGVALDGDARNVAGRTFTASPRVLDSDPALRHVRPRLEVRSPDGAVRAVDTRAALDVGWFDFPVIDGARLASGAGCAVLPRSASPGSTRACRTGRSLSIRPAAVRDRRMRRHAVGAECRSREGSMDVARRTAILAVLAAAVAGSGCFEAPVRETVTIRFVAQGGALVTADVRLGPWENFKEKPAVLDRLARLERDIREGRDPWRQRVLAAEPEALQTTTEEWRGRIERLTLRTFLEEADRVDKVFADTGVRVAFAASEGWAELSFLPDSDGDATSQERRLLEEQFLQWTPRVTAYLAAVADLYAYLDGRPERARDVLGAYFEDDLDDGVKRTLGEPTDGESALVDRLNEASEGIVSVLTVPDGEAYTLDELSRKVHDPFPAKVRVVVPGPVLEREGFSGTGEDPLVITPRSLWTAFAGLEGRWADPDPVVALVRHDLDGKKTPFNLDGFVSRPRRHGEPPGEPAVRSALVEELKPEPFYRVRWSTEGLAEEDLDEVLRAP